MALIRGARTPGIFIGMGLAVKGHQGRPEGLNWSPELCPRPLGTSGDTKGGQQEAPLSPIKGKGEDRPGGPGSMASLAGQRVKRKEIGGKGGLGRARKEA